jgi:probable rRNA maturation factor
MRHAIISVAFVSNRRIAALNRQILGHRGTTDVISLAFRRRSAREPVIGDIYVAADVVRANARAAGIPVRQEAARVVLHGLLHTLGLEHPEVSRERSAMWRAQEHLLSRAAQEHVW